jgi:hypothetical protein
MDEVMGPLHFVTGSAGCADQPSACKKYFLIDRREG